MGNATRNIFKIKNNREYNVLIPAAGLGTRMRSYSAKPIIKIAQKTLIQHQLDIINGQWGKNTTTIVVGYDANKVMNAIPNTTIKVENESYATSNVVRSIGLGLRAHTRDSVIIIYGDLFINASSLRFECGNESFLVVENQNMDINEIGCTISDTNKIEYMRYDTPMKWAQVAYLTGRELELMKNIAWNPNNKNLYGYEAINIILDKGGQFKSVNIPGAFFRDIDCAKDITYIEENL
jgi:NDP-sugar pyrophosphorylase family protein